ncbi:Asp-tRNA(Asn)/Glu-tRNA(Gln) amidotransferase subunit GatA [Reinekea marinisedimentorum]|uniref:Glutamyl-tRNA(Gln) amidotransferase subunit A n=1 Tax=Reinekea marinisedimentorum TaxID=230495 RepID=A0A4R3I578_9GAMM|nr:Asp-tRNA(Asn)/Glu-tRNA(Gln) amidotransferase subunit GatA [Reinekea marinisedimentorum]TCS40093.1 aspartyl-tRNA(Asn)/glutamyl-tRNA(Gln) amidotransferase subunit A [Reinekea marinisedimentorum]
MENKTLKQLSAGLASGEFSSTELTRHYLDKIKQHDGTYNAYITVTEEQALAAAKQADEQIAAGNAGDLTGLPIAYKDLFCTQGVRTSCGSKILDNFVSPYESTATDNLNKAGMVMLGKTNLDEFAMGSSTESSYYGATRNPWDTDAVPGGSSGGSAVAVAADLAPVSLGTDTGGSIRQPAAFCGITGLKPTYGRVSRWGMVAYGSSLDQAGPMAQNAEDAAMIMNALAGFDAKDSTSMDKPVDNYLADLNKPIKGLKIGLPKEFFGDSLDDGIRAAVMDAVKQLEAQGAIVKEISLPRTELAIPAYYIIAPAEASTNLSRFDGVRYGYRCEDPQDLADMYIRSRSEGFGAEVKRRILVGTYALSAGYYDAYYRKAQQLRRMIKQDFQAALADVDVIAGPTTPSPAWKIGAKNQDPVAMYLEDIYTLSVNLAGLPGISVPCGMKDGLPVGLQIIGDYFSEAKLLNIGHQFQQATDWHTRKPTVGGNS